MRLPFLSVDVFTTERFGGNQLAVLPDARGLTTEQMQAITREFNFAESTFVLPPASPEHDAHVRIFTPGQEVPFAGHPNVGTAYALACLGHVHGKPVGDLLRFEEAAGLVTLTIARDDEGRPVSTEFTAPQPFAIMDERSIAHVAAACGLSDNQIETSQHAPLIASVGLPFTIAELPDIETLSAARPISPAFDEHYRGKPGDALLLYVRTGGETARARMFAPLHGVAEDPATGSAAAALTGLLASLASADNGHFPLAISQGEEVFRPSLIHGIAEKTGGTVTAVRVGGPSVLVTEGFITI